MLARTYQSPHFFEASQTVLYHVYVQLEKQGLVTSIRFRALITLWVFIEPSLALGA